MKRKVSPWRELRSSKNEERGAALLQEQTVPSVPYSPSFRYALTYLRLRFNAEEIRTF